MLHGTAITGRTPLHWTPVTITPTPHSQDGFWPRLLRPLGAVLGAFALSIPIAGLMFATPLPREGAAAVTQFATSALILLFALLLWRSLPHGERQAVVRRPTTVVRLAAVGIAVGLGMVVLSVTIVATGIALDPTARRRLDDVNLEMGVAPWQIGLMVIALVVLAPIGEELIFRGLVLRALRRRLAFFPAALISAVLFAAAHLEAWVIWPRALSLVVLGLALAYLFRRYGLFAAIAAHATVNSVAAAALVATG